MVTSVKSSANSIHLIQTNMTSGEFSPRLPGRVDLSKYPNSLHILENMYPLPHGGAYKRSGTRHIKSVKTPAEESVLIPFEYSITQAYILELGDLYIRFFKDEGQILSGTIPYEIASPWTEDQVGALRTVQSADVLFVCHPDVRPKKITRSAHTTWTIDDLDFQDGPYLAQNKTTTTLAKSATTGSITITASSIVGINNGTGFQSTDVGRWIRIQRASNDVWGAAQITSVTDTTHVVATVHDDFPFSSAAAETTWMLGAWSDTTGWPSAKPAFFEGKLVLGSTRTQPDTLFFSETDSFESFTPSAADGTVAANHGMTRTINATKVNNIMWIHAEDVLLAGTSDVIFVIKEGPGTDAFGPTNISSKPQARTGTADITPVEATDSILFVSRSTTKLRQLEFSFEKDKYIAPDVSLLSEHLGKGGIRCVTYNEEPNNIVYTCLLDGGLASLTYQRDQEVVAWARQILGGTDVVIKSMATVPSVDGLSDTTYLIVERTINGATVKYVEFFEEFYDPDDVTDMSDAFYLDSGATYTGTATNTISGLEHLEGETVRVLINGSVHGDLVVTSGVITLNNNKTTTKAHVGLPIISKMKTQRPEISLPNGSAQGRDKIVDKIWLRLYKSLGGQFGTDTTDLEDIPYRQTDDPMDSPPPLKTGDVSMLFPGRWNEDGQLYLEHSDPLPFNVLSIIKRVKVAPKS